MLSFRSKKEWAALCKYMISFPVVLEKTKTHRKYNAPFPSFGFTKNQILLYITRKNSNTQVIFFQKLTKLRISFLSRLFRSLYTSLKTLAQVDGGKPANLNMLDKLAHSMNIGQVRIGWTLLGSVL